MKKTWFDDMANIWVTKVTRKAINDLRNFKGEPRLRTADDVIQDAIKALKEKENKRSAT